jgi:hypothetical protein
LKKLILGLLFLASLNGLSSCSSSSDSATPAVTQLPGSKGTMTATVNGQSFVSNYAVAVKTGVFSISGANTSISGTKQINLSGIISQTGTYQMTDKSTSNNYAIGLYVEGNLKTYSATSGTLIITELSTTKAKGTFSFSATSGGTETINITNGAFDINL